jgi:hypothetical protein
MNLFPPAKAELFTSEGRNATGQLTFGGEPKVMLDSRAAESGRTKQSRSWFMKENTATASESPPDEYGSASEIEASTYAKELRTLGQDLEAHNLSSLDLEIEGGFYVIRGTAKPLKASESSLPQFLADLVYNFSFSSSQPNSTCEINLRYSPKDIEQLEAQGRARRKESRKMPDPFSLSQILRGAGSYLDARTETYLEGITVKEQFVCLRYKTADGRLEQAKQDIEYFYNYWIKMYLRRSNRPKLPPPNDPSLTVAWDSINKRLELTPCRFSNFI